MNVIDVLSFGGWYVEVLPAAVGHSGRVIAQNSLRYLKTDLYKDVVQEVKEWVARLNNVELYFKNIRDLRIDGKIDSALIAPRLRDVYIYDGEEVAIGLLEQIYKALKPGGTISVIDYVGIEDQDNKKLHRIEKTTVRQLLTNAGFEFEAQSDLLANSKDDRLSVVVSVLDPSSSLKPNSERIDRILIRTSKLVR